jgi:hypothetical protein
MPKLFNIPQFSDINSRESSSISYVRSVYVYRVQFNRSQILQSLINFTYATSESWFTNMHFHISCNFQNTDHSLLLLKSNFKTYVDLRMRRIYLWYFARFGFKFRVQQKYLLPSHTPLYKSYVI